MKNFSMPSARNMLRQVVGKMEAPALDYIDWPQFELELDELMAKQPTAAQVKQVFAKAVTRAREKYHKAVLSGGAWAGKRPK